MAVVKRADSDLVARSAVVLDLGDLRRRAEELEAKTIARARQIIDEANAERQRLLAGAAEQGRETGHAAGLARGVIEGREQGKNEAIASMRAQADALSRGFEAALGALVEQREALLTQARTDVLKLAVAIARRVTRRSIDADPRAVMDQLEAALAMTLRPTTLIVEVHPDDAALVREAAPALAKKLAGGPHVEVVERAELSRGSVVLRSAGGEVDASIETQLERIVEAIVPVATPHAETDAAAGDDDARGAP